MNLPYEGLHKIMTLIQWVLKQGRDKNDFVKNVYFAFKPFYNLHRTLSFCEDQATVTIPFALAMDINSIILAHEDDWVQQC